MNKTELIAEVAKKADISRKDAEQAVTAMLNTIIEEVAEGREVRIVGFGTFECRERKERMGTNPHSLDKIVIPASKVPAFKAGKGFKDTVDKK